MEDYIYGLIVFGLSLYVGYAVKFSKQYAVAIILLGGIFTAIQAISLNITGGAVRLYGSGKTFSWYRVAGFRNNRIHNFNAKQH